MTITAPAYAVPREQSPARTRAVAVWLLVCCAMIVAMVVIGGVTRLTESGLSITEWKPVSGTLPPLSDAEWQAEFEKYQQIPEYRERNAGMTLDEYKTIFWWEYVHRLWGRLIGAAYLLPFLAFLALGRIRGALAWRLGGIFILGGLQGALGWYMVKSGLVDQVDVSPFRLTAHLGLAVIIYAATLWTALDLLRPEGNVDRRALALAAFVFLTMMSGGFVAGLDAGMIYNTFPLMDGQIVPPGYLDDSPWWMNWFENPAAVQFNHRILGVSTLTLALLYWNARGGVLGALVGCAGLLQASLGISTLLLVVPIPLAALHQLGAVTLFTVALIAAQAGRAIDANALSIAPRHHIS